MKKLGKIKVLTISALSAVALAGSIALAQTTATDPNVKQQKRGEWSGEGRHFGERGGRGHGGMFRGVTLTEDQKARMKQIHESFNERTKSLREQLHAKRQELRQANEGGTFNETLATQKLQEMTGLEAKLMGERFNLRQETLSVLTPEQKTQLEQKRAEFKGRRGERRQR
ncbi:MAG TPA: Spy/CpxP family protein refolding chaperone [Pyrinomonadaceae bacterium]|nr:Spy/CpxP family protein refolding chaperone [Pyrinomonadaceae bacterium]